MRIYSITGGYRLPKYIRWLTVMLMCFVILGNPSPAKAKNEFHLSNEFSTTYNDISGPGSRQSSLKQGFSYLNVLNVNNLGKYKGFDYIFNFGFKLTDDRANDVKNVSMTNLQGRISNKIHTVNIGDTFETFSQYSLSSALKGASYRFVKENTYIPEVTLIHGYAYPRWDNVFAVYEGRVPTVQRLVTGARIKENFGKTFWAGLSYVHSMDDYRVNTWDKLYTNNAYTFDFEYRPIKGLTVSGESSFTDQKESPGEGLGEKSRHGSAYKITAVGDGDPSRVTLEYERVATNFTTLVGSATPDREKTKAKWRYKFSKNITANTGFLWFRDNLDGQKLQGRTDYYKPEIGLAFRRLFGRSSAVADIAYKLDIASNNNSENMNHITTLNYQDIFFGFLDSDINLGYTWYDNKIQTSARSNEFTYNTSLSSRHSYNSFILKPAVHWGIRASRDELAVSSDQLYEYSGGFGLDIPNLKITSNLKAGENSLKKSTGQDSSKIFASFTLNYKPSFLDKLNHGMLFLRAQVNSFTYNSVNSDYRETSVTAGLNMQF
ncbi:MAG: hypothetical protein C0394_01695 [Syntrophus sp. (in: bacteria)]|nr:hypothetical protein [Syntrophus sp. (in: bacteria)]